MAKGTITTSNVTSWGSLAPCLETLESHVVLVQEHHRRDEAKLADLQHEVLDHGFAGIWAPAVAGPTSAEGTTGGVAVLARKNIPVTAPPLLPSATLWPGRLVAAHVHWGVRGGIVFVSAYLVDSVGMNDVNRSIFGALTRYLTKLTASGIDWIVGGDFNGPPSCLPLAQLEKAGGLWLAPSADTCRPQAGSGSVLDYFLVGANLASRISAPRVDELGITSPHLPVNMELRAADLDMRVRIPIAPRAIPAVPPIGCSRGVEDWAPTLAQVRATTSAEELPAAWDAVVSTLEQELLDRYDQVGEARRRFEGRAGPIATKLAPVKWKPQGQRVRLGPDVIAAKVAGRWARHFMGVSAFLAKASRRLQTASLQCSLVPEQYHELADFVARALEYGRVVMDSKKTLALLPHWVRSFFEQGFRVIGNTDFLEQAGRIVQFAKDAHADALKVRQQSWIQWANDSLRNGAGKAHRFTKLRAMQEVLAQWQGTHTELTTGRLAQTFVPQQQVASQHLICDREMKAWEDVWSCHKLEALERPADFDEWDDLEDLTVEALQRAACSFPTTTALGPAQIGMRALTFLTDDGVYTCGQLFMKCEALGAWPSERLWHAMCRIPKASGGCRLITLMHSLIRWWSRARASTSKAWLTAHPNASIWGMGGGRSSSDSAFDLNLETEVSDCLDEHVVIVMLDAWKFFETIKPEWLLIEARLLGMPLRLVWMLIELYRQPRRLQAFGSVSYAVVSHQGVLAGCTHACAMVTLLMFRLLEQVRDAGVTPRALIDDVTLQWRGRRLSQLGVLWAATTRFREGAQERGIVVQPTKSGYLVSSDAAARECARHAAARKLTKMRWARNLGHDLGGRRIARLQTAKRVRQLKERRGKLAAFKGADVRMHLTGGVQRWQARQIAAHHRQHGEVKPWVRAMRLCVGDGRAALAEGPSATSLRHHWATVAWTQQAQHDLGLAAAPNCRACGHPSDSPGHRFFGCEVLVQPLTEEEQDEQLPPEPMQAIRTFMCDKGLQEGGSFESADFQMCLPCMPPFVPPAAEQAEVKFWGCWPSQGADTASCSNADMDAYLDRGLHPLLYSGNMWADWFARQGAMQHTVSKVYEEFYNIELQHYKSLAKYVGWAMQRTMHAGRWDAPEQTARPPKVPKVQAATVISHSLVRLNGTAVVLRRACCRQTSGQTGPTWTQFARSACEASQYTALRAEAIIAHVGAQPIVVSEAGEFAMQAIERAACPEDAGPRPAEPAPWGSGDGTIEMQGHRLRRAGPTIYCEVCVAWAATGSSLALAAPCAGPPSAEGKNQRTYLSNLRARLKKLSQGLHPKTGKVLTWGGAGEAPDGPRTWATAAASAAAGDMASGGDGAAERPSGRHAQKEQGEATRPGQDHETREVPAGAGGSDAVQTKKPAWRVRRQELLERMQRRQQHLLAERGPAAASGAQRDEGDMADGSLPSAYGAHQCPDGGTTGLVTLQPPPAAPDVGVVDACLAAGPSRLPAPLRCDLAHEVTLTTDHQEGAVTSPQDMSSPPQPFSTTDMASTRGGRGPAKCGRECGPALSAGRSDNSQRALPGMASDKGGRRPASRDPECGPTLGTGGDGSQAHRVRRRFTAWARGGRGPAMCVRECGPALSPGCDEDRDGKGMASARGGRGPAKCSPVCGPALGTGSGSLEAASPEEDQRQPQLASGEACPRAATAGARGGRGPAVCGPECGPALSTSTHPERRRITAWARGGRGPAMCVRECGPALSPGSDADRDGMCMASTRGGRGPASADRVCGPALSAGRVAVARPEPAQPRRSVAPRLELQVAGWARYWTQAPEVGETMECYSEWLDHCVGYVTQILSQPRFATRLRARGRTAEEMAEEICERAWGTGMPARRAYYRWRHTLTRSQRIVSDCMRRYDYVCLRTWLAELRREGQPPPIGPLRAPSEATEKWLRVGLSWHGQPLRGRAALRVRRRDRHHWPPLRLRPPGRLCCV
ncbi:unnamed protein product [Prorocentrum cordatum]|uniref:Endonuclease/exonuclease/phosphatase domain-containing protein n=1 Tax=Prorocentrum cordatum TaxID=2364126 RepID=A0ABN9SYX4_9DINO|nr:unnamed protein product [Polarella glacialis]